MKRISVADAARIMRGAGRLGDYGMDDPNAAPGGELFNNGQPYSEEVVFNGNIKGSVATIKEYAAVAIQQEAEAPPPPVRPPYTNDIVSALYPFDLSNGSSQIINSNPQRTLLIIQNQNASGGADLFFNLGNGASVAAGILLVAGEAVLFDVKCPSDSVYVFSPGVCHGVVMQSSQTVQQGL